MSLEGQANKIYVTQDLRVTQSQTSTHLPSKVGLVAKPGVSCCPQAFNSSHRSLSQHRPALEPLYHSQLRNHLHGITTTLHSPRFNNSQNLVTWLLKVASNNTPSNWPEPSNLHQQSLQVSHQAHPPLCKRTSPVASHSSTLCTH